MVLVLLVLWQARGWMWESRLTTSLWCSVLRFCGELDALVWHWQLGLSVLATRRLLVVWNAALASLGWLAVAVGQALLLWEAPFVWPVWWPEQWPT